MKRKLHLVDYTENGMDRYQVIEAIGIGCLTDSEMVQLLHFYIGKNNMLTMVAEFETDMSIDDFCNLCDTGRNVTMPRRILYVDVKEIMKGKECVSK